jgi:hypothetical protein
MGSLSLESDPGLPTVIKIGRLGDPELQASIDRALSGINTGGGNVALTFEYGAGKGSVGLTVAQRFGANWSIGAIIDVSDLSDLRPRAGVEIMGRW